MGVSRDIRRRWCILSLSDELWRQRVKVVYIGTDEDGFLLVVSVLFE